MNKTTDILRKYTAGETTLEEANGILAKSGAGFHLDPARNTLTEEEKRASSVGYYPDQANGFGLLDSGTSTLDKVEVRQGQLAHCDMGDSYALVFLCGKMYRVQGRALVE